MESVHEEAVVHPRAGVNHWHGEFASYRGCSREPLGSGEVPQPELARLGRWTNPTVAVARATATASRIAESAALGEMRKSPNSGR